MQGTYILRYLRNYTYAGSKDCQLQTFRTPPYLLHNKQSLHKAQPRCVCLFWKPQVYLPTHLHKISLSIGRYTPEVLSKEGNPNLNPTLKNLSPLPHSHHHHHQLLISHFCHKIRNLQPLAFICRAPIPERFGGRQDSGNLCKIQTETSNYLLKFGCEVEARGS